jgi:murein DD-endopeptidase MepM/ murein hydrolase activator NlpD
MPSAMSPSSRVGRTTLATATAIVLATLLVGGAPLARAAGAGQLRRRINAGQGRVSALAGAVSSAEQRVSRLAASAADRETQIAQIQAALNVKRAQLLAVRAKLAKAQLRLGQLQAAERRAQGVLARQLVGRYEEDSPDIVTVVLEATGFQSLLEQMDFAQRIGRQDAEIAGRVSAARRAVSTQATHLGALSERRQQLAIQVLSARNRVARERLALLRRQVAAEHARSARAKQLAAARGQVASLQSQLGKVDTAWSGGGSSAAGRQRFTANGFTFPMPKADVSPPATWSPDDGVDISAPGGTPEFAVCPGTIVLHGIGGFGPSAPVIRCDSPVDGYDFVYYGHAGPGNWVPVGTHVNRGQVISEVGSGIVGISTAPHLEIGFANSTGSPIGPASASAMLSLLRASYGA